MKKISPDQVSTILTLLNEGKSCREIATILSLSKSTVSRYRKMILNPTSESASGRPRKLTSRDKRSLARLIMNGEAKTAIDAMKLINLEREDKISVATARRALKDQGFSAIKKKRKPRLSKAHRRARLTWALAHGNWTEEDWNCVIFSDETKINRINSDGIKYTWGKDPEKLGPEMVEETLKFGGGNLMIWGCMSWFGVGGTDRVVGRRDSKQLLSILESSLLPTVAQAANQLGSPARTNLIFQQDNDPKHISAAIKNWLATRDIKTMDWPSQSPDLNPIEHLRGLLKRQLGKYPESPRSIHELWSRVGRNGVD